MLRLMEGQARRAEDSAAQATHFRVEVAYLNFTVGTSSAGCSWAETAVRILQISYCYDFAGVHFVPSELNRSKLSRSSFLHAGKRLNTSVADRFSQRGRSVNRLRESGRGIRQPVESIELVERYPSRTHVVGFLDGLGDVGLGQDYGLGQWVSECQAGG